jgi:hypothetical protein
MFLKLNDTNETVININNINCLERDEKFSNNPSFAPIYYINFQLNNYKIYCSYSSKETRDNDFNKIIEK